MSELRTQGDPIAVPYDAVTSALELLGIHNGDLAIRDVTQVVIEPKRIIVTRRQRDDDGHLVTLGDPPDEYATWNSVIDIRRDES